MSTASKEGIESHSSLPDKTIPRSLSIAASGVKTGADFASLMSAVMSDLIAGDMTPAVGNAVCNAGGKLLKVVEMQHKYGKSAQDSGVEKVLKLVP